MSLPRRVKAWLKRRRLELWRLNGKARFTTLFERERWVSEESASGPGSDRSSGSVRHALMILEAVTTRFGVRSIADMPCGDVNWIGEYLSAHPHVDYVGYDIVEPLIAQNRTAYPERRFEVLDITRQTPPTADLVFSKDLVNHLVEADVWAALERMVASGATWIMVTSNAECDRNVELDLMTPRSSRPLNLRVAPYHFPEPVFEDHYLPMWRTADLKRLFAARAR
ncbi:hypothetical protein BH10PSE2_BH10PSE2_20700 [soil metagenome]